VSVRWSASQSTITAALSNISQQQHLSTTFLIVGAAGAAMTEPAAAPAPGAHSPHGAAAGRWGVLMLSFSALGIIYGDIGEQQFAFVGYHYQFCEQCRASTTQHGHAS
jgi:hypothetical protein